MIHHDSIFFPIRNIQSDSCKLYSYYNLFPQRAATESRNQEAKPSRRSTTAKGADSTGSKVTATGAVDTIDGVVLQNGSPYESTRKSDAFVLDYDDRPSKEDDAMPPKKSSMKKSSNDVNPIFFSFIKTQMLFIILFSRGSSDAVWNNNPFLSFRIIEIDRCEYNNVKYSLLRVAVSYKLNRNPRKSKNIF